MADLNPGDGNAEALRRHWLYGKGALRIQWGQPGDWQRCVDAIGGKYMTTEQAKGFCNLLHQRAVGQPPGKGH